LNFLKLFVNEFSKLLEILIFSRENQTAKNLICTIFSIFATDSFSLFICIFVFFIFYRYISKRNASKNKIKTYYIFIWRFCRRLRVTKKLCCKIVKFCKKISRTRSIQISNKFENNLFRFCFFYFYRQLVFVLVSIFFRILNIYQYTARHIEIDKKIYRKTDKNIYFQYFLKKKIDQLFYFDKNFILIFFCFLKFLLELDLIL